MASVRPMFWFDVEQLAVTSPQLIFTRCQCQYSFSSVEHVSLHTTQENMVSRLTRRSQLVSHKGECVIVFAVFVVFCE